MGKMKESEKKSGIILKGIGGFYYVETADGVFECKAKGKFRKERITPLAGDRVVIEVNQNAENTICSIEERKNFLPDVLRFFSISLHRELLLRRNYDSHCLKYT